MTNPPVGSGCYPILHIVSWEERCIEDMLRQVAAERRKHINGCRGDTPSVLRLAHRRLRSAARYRYRLGKTHI